jgi:hypothetical protein
MEKDHQRGLPQDDCSSESRRSVAGYEDEESLVGVTRCNSSSSSGNSGAYSEANPPAVVIVDSSKDVLYHHDTSPPQSLIRECRICLQIISTNEDDDQDRGVEPCACRGSLQYAHIHCLKSWVHERRQLVCEICKTPYKEELIDECLREEAETLQIIPVTQVLPQTENQRHRRAVVTTLIFTCVILAIIVVLIVLGLNAGDHAWAAILLRIIAFGLPVLIIGRALFLCCEMRSPGFRLW